MSPDTLQHQLSVEVKQLQPDSLALSDYSRQGLQRVVSAVEYYLEIYRYSLEKVLECCSLSPDEITIVDYGGGHGLLSIFAKRLGFARVIYVDASPDAVQTVQLLSQRLQSGPDAILQGDAETLRRWCADRQVTPDALLAMDVIEHIYVLDDFFASLHTLSPRLRMLFTTASNPYNSRVVRRLHYAMVADEQGHGDKKGFLQLRREYIKQQHPDMPDKQIDYWAKNTRGLKYVDIDRAVDSQSPNLLLDPYNTCDPQTGSWTERILPIDDYRHLLAPYGFRLTLLPGHYNTHRRGPKEWMSVLYNKQIAQAGDKEPETRRERRQYNKALKHAPFVYIIV